MSPKRVAISIFVPVMLVILWHVSVRRGWVTPSYAAGPLEVISAIGEDYLRLLHQLTHSLKRLILGVTLGTVSGLITGVMLAKSETFDQLLNPTIQFLAPIPVVVWLPFFIMVFGIGEIYKVGLVVLAAFLLVHIHTFSAAVGMDKRFGELADLYQKSAWQRFSKLIVPGVLPSLVTGVRIALALSWIVLFIVEFGDARADSGGLGYHIKITRDLGRIDESFAGVVVLGVAAFLIDVLLVMGARFLLRWRDTGHE